MAIFTNRTPHFNHNEENFKNFNENHKLNISVRWFETDDMVNADRYWRDPDGVIRSEEYIKRDIGFDEIVDIVDHRG